MSYNSHICFLAILRLSFLIFNRTFAVYVPYDKLSLLPFRNKNYVFTKVGPYPLQTCFKLLRRSFSLQSRRVTIFPQVQERKQQKKPSSETELILRDQLEPRGPEAYRSLQKARAIDWKRASKRYEEQDLSRWVPAPPPVPLQLSGRHSLLPTWGTATTEIAS